MLAVTSPLTKPRRLAGTSTWDPRGIHPGHEGKKSVAPGCQVQPTAGRTPSPIPTNLLTTFLPDTQINRRWRLWRQTVACYFSSLARMNGRQHEDPLKHTIYDLTVIDALFVLIYQTWRNSICQRHFRFRPVVEVVGAFPVAGLLLPPLPADSCHLSNCLHSPTFSGCSFRYLAPV